MRKHQSELSAREKRFCCYYAADGNIKDAAAAAGYKDPDKQGAELLMRKEIIAELDRLYSARLRNYRQRARAGYERLAFGNICDAVRLMFQENPLGEELSGYDLFNVAEIKRPKDGALEIKFFDRIKALEKLEAADQEQQDKLSDFYTALIHSSNTPSEVENS